VLNLSDVIARLAIQCPGFKLVAGAAEFAAISDAVPIYPAAWVIPLGDSPAENTLMAGGVMQTVDSVFGVLIAVRDLTDQRGEAGVDAVRERRVEVVEALLGWTPNTNEVAPIEYAGGRLVAFASGFVWWQEEFSTSYYLRAIG
jgi:hypothetical protein